MLLVAGELRVSLVTGHVPLREVPRRLDERRIREVFRLTHDALRAGFDVERPRLAVCGLNPHAGDGGTLGEEDERLVAPVVRALRGEGFDVTGPVPADTVFVRAIAGEFDAVLALYHDQGMIPIKVHGFGRGVNVTLGLPFVRTSPDHGTALDIAGRGVARPASFAAALALARDLGGRPGFVRTPVVKAARVQ
jgi:4-hydroxythreonine-4-phosphate dehydrogenase